MRRNELVERILVAAVSVHQEIGPGMPESLYDACLARELEHHQLAFTRNVLIPVVYRDLKLDFQYRIDFLVEEQVVVETRALPGIKPSDTAQLRAALRRSGQRFGILLNFHAPTMKLGLRTCRIGRNDLI